MTVNHDAVELKADDQPDHAQAMRQAHMAMVYDQWFRAQVQQGLEDTRATAHHGMVVADLRVMLKGMADKCKACKLNGYSCVCHWQQKNS